MARLWLVSILPSLLLFGQEPNPSSTASGTLSNGVRYEFRQYFEPTIPPDKRINLGAGVATTRDQRVRRLFWDPSEGTYYGYEVTIEPESDTRKFRVQFGALQRNAAETFPELFRLSERFRQIEALPLPNPVTLAAGDTLRWKVLVNEKTGHAIVDTLRVYGNPGWITDPMAGPARDVTLQDLELRWIGATVFRNERLLHRFPAASGVAGKYTWLELPDSGRIFLAIAPVPDYAFSPAGTLEGSVARFQIGPDEYQIHCEQPIFRSNGRWNLYLWHDRAFASRGFAFGAADRLLPHRGGPLN